MVPVTIMDKTVEFFDAGYKPISEIDIATWQSSSDFPISVVNERGVWSANSSS